MSGNLLVVIVEIDALSFRVEELQKVSAYTFCYGMIGGFSSKLD